MQAATLPVAVNYHLNKNCNFRCKGCYATFDDDRSIRGAMLPKDRMFGIVDAVASTPLPEGRTARKLTFAGGEPTLCPWLPELISHAKARGLVTMLVTNGSRCDTAYLERLAPVLDWITLSIDSLNDTTNRQIGRHNGRGEPISQFDYAEILFGSRKLGIRTKINTVVNRMNHGEDLTGFLLETGIARWKILQVMPVAGQNDASIRDLEIPRDRFDAFVARHYAVAEAGIRVVPEPVDSIRGSYCMIDPQGRFFDSTSGGHRYSRPILEVGIAAAFSEVSFDHRLFVTRGGLYEFQSAKKTSPEIRGDDKQRKSA
jgi:radical S-adenosyl methionine domain-containing protein 2